jgi:hypothetical protein
VDQWCVPEKKYGRTPLHFLALSIVGKMIAAPFEYLLVMFHLLADLAGEDCRQRRDKVGKTAAEYLGPAYENYQFPVGVKTELDRPSPALEKETCCHVFVELLDGLKNFSMSRMAWEENGVVCSACDTALSISEACRCMSGEMCHKACAGRTLSLELNGKTINCGLCTLPVPKKWEKMITDALDRGKQEMQCRNFSQDAVEWRVVESGRTESFILANVLDELEFIQANNVSLIRATHNQLRNPHNGRYQSTFLLQARRRENRRGGPQAGLFGGGPLNGHEHLPRSSSAQIYDRARIKTALAVGDTVRARNDRLGRNEEDAGAGNNNGNGGGGGLFVGGGFGHGGPFGFAAGHGIGGGGGDAAEILFETVMNNPTRDDFF